MNAMRGRPSELDFDLLDADPASIALVRRDGTIEWVNRAWLVFGQENGADMRAISVGTSYFAAVAGDARAWLVRAVEACIEGDRILEADYECSSRSQVRTFRMRLLPHHDTGVLVEHSLRVARPRVEPLVGADERCYRSAQGVIVMCSNCRRTLRGDADVWDFVSQWTVEPPPRVSHGICRVCSSYFY